MATPTVIDGGGAGIPDESRAARNRFADRKLSDTPPPYPYGWFAVAFSSELRPGSLLRRRFMDRDIVVFRTRSGIACAAEAYCPHLGAHLGAGNVEGEDLRCPFHGFTFSTTGKCTYSPYGRPPPAARLGLLELREVTGLVMVWHGPEGETPWEIEAPPEDRPWQPWRQTTRKLASHPQELTENGVDIGHLLITHHFENVRTVEPFTIDGPRLRMGYAFLRKFPLIGLTDVRIFIRVDGLGYSLVEITIGGKWSLRELVVSTPVGEREVEVRVGFALSGRGDSRTSRALWRPLIALAQRIMFPMALVELHRDEVIWEEKKYLDRPAIADGDGPLAQYRAWARDFYPREAGN